jgi:threonine synthase
MMFISTRGSAPALSIGAAISEGLAPDGGLYVPQSLPTFSPADFTGGDSLASISMRLLAPFFAGDPLATELEFICHAAFSFPAPLYALATPNDHILELFHGPTAAFKDFGARFLAACMSRLRRDTQPPRTILVATSGDTGAAVGAAFAAVPGFRVVILYPDGRVSSRQAHQLGCFGENVLALRVQGSFDDCQRLAKHALNDTALRALAPLSSANSISLGRLLPQMSYYAQAALTHWRIQGNKLNFVVPTGNLGNAMACALARACGLPIGRIALACNANRTLPDFFAGADYTPRDSLATLANAMDVGAPSNFERLRWLYPDTPTLRKEFASQTVGDTPIRTTIHDTHRDGGRILCPHTATAAKMLADLRANGASGTWVIVATAHPAKFESVVDPLIGSPTPIPNSLAQLLARPSRDEALKPDYAALREHLVAD